MNSTGSATRFAMDCLRRLRLEENSTNTGAISCSICDIYYIDIKYIRKEVCYLKSISKFAMVSPEAKRIINELESGELKMKNVPEEFALDSNIVTKS